MLNYQVISESKNFIVPYWDIAKHLACTIFTKLANFNVWGYLPGRLSIKCRAWWVFWRIDVWLWTTIACTWFHELGTKNFHFATKKVYIHYRLHDHYAHPRSICFPGLAISGTQQPCKRAIQWHHTGYLYRVHSCILSYTHPCTTRLPPCS